VENRWCYGIRSLGQPFSTQRPPVLRQGFLRRRSAWLWNRQERRNGLDALLSIGSGVSFRGGSKWEVERGRGLNGGCAQGKRRRLFLGIGRRENGQFESRSLHSRWESRLGKRRFARSRVLKGVCKGQHAAKAGLRLLCQRLVDHPLHGFWELGKMFPQRRRRRRQMLSHELGWRSLKRHHASEPLVDNHGQRVLVALHPGMAAKLLWRGIGQGACKDLGLHRCRGVGSGGDAEIAEQDSTLLTNQEILWFDIAMNQLVLMGIL